MKQNKPSELIPLFPLRGALLLPNTRLPLNVFEPRYLKMVDDALKSDHRLIGMIQPTDKKADNPGLRDTKDLYGIGCAGRISSFDELEDGRYLITLSGFSRFALLKTAQDSSYLQGVVDWSKYSIDTNEKIDKSTVNIDSFFNVVSDYFKSKNISTDWNSLKNADHNTLINSLSMLCPFENYEKQALLEAHSIFDRKEVLTTLMEISSQNQGNDIIQ